MILFPSDGTKKEFCMDKNTIWALVLSGLVLVGSLLVEAFVILPKQQAAQLQRQEQIVAQEAQKAEEQVQIEEQIAVLEESAAEEIEEAEEQQYTIKTDKIEVVFTNRGGDVVSYRLLEHLDKNSGLGVQMADSITPSNRAFSLAFGNSSSAFINDIFKVKTEGDRVIIFYREFERKDSLGKPQKFTLVKRYEFRDGDYVFNLGIEIKTQGSASGFSVNDYAYTLRTSPQIGPYYDRKNDRYDTREYLAYNAGKRVKKGFTNKTYDKGYEWVGVGGKYFAILIKPADVSTMANSVRCSNESNTDYENSQVFITRKAIEAGSSVTQDTYYVYVGPRSESELKKYNSTEQNKWGLVNAKFNQAINDTGFFSLFGVALKWALEMIYRLVKNWGVAIIILTILLKIVLFPLNKSSAVGNLKMQELQPKMKAIQDQYKDNQQKLSEEMAKLYKQAGYNPASGCLPMILQMFILISMFHVFNNYFEFRGASFIPGWIDDLSTGDVLFKWERNIPVLSSLTNNCLRLLPIIYLGSQLLNGLVTQTGTAAGQTQAQMKFMMFGLPIMFFFMFYNVPSGLMFYWSVSNLFQIIQQLAINQIMKSKKAELATKAPVVNKNELKFKGGKKKTR